MILAIAAGLCAALGVAVAADLTGHPLTSQILLVLTASFGGAVLGGLVLLRPWVAPARPVSGGALRAATADELFEMARIGCWQWDARLDTVTWNPGMYAIHGVDSTAFVPTRHSILDLIAPEDVQAVLDTWWKDQDGPPGGMIECRIVRPDGERRHVRYSWHTQGSPDGSPQVFGIAQDITALRAGGRASRHEDAHLRGMVECSADYIWEYRADAGAAPLEGLRLQSLGGGAAGAGTPAVDRAGGHDFAPLERLIGNREKFRDVVIPVLDAGGEARRISLSGHPQFDREGVFYGYRGVAADVTESIRKRDLAEGRRQAGAVSRLASGIAHEINNLLQPILIYAAFGADEANQHEKMRLYFTRIARAAERATFIVKNVLSFARTASPGQDDFDALVVVREAVDRIRATLGAGLSLEVVAGEDDLPVRAEHAGLAQIVTNLIANAADAMPEGGRIVVRAGQVFVAGETAKAAGIAPGNYCLVSVEDSGPGIAPEFAAKVFDPFFTTKPQGKGTGLGLAVVSGLARGWGGGASVESAPGRGSRFNVYLPVAVRELRAAQ